MELIYIGTRDDMTANKFHNKCNNKSKTIILFLYLEDILLLLGQIMKEI